MSFREHNSDIESEGTEEDEEEFETETEPEEEEEEEVEEALPIEEEDNRNEEEQELELEQEEEDQDIDQDLDQDPEEDIDFDLHIEHKNSNMFTSHMVDQKQEQEDSSSSENEMTKTTPKKRGRKPKNQAGSTPIIATPVTKEIKMKKSYEERQSESQNRADIEHLNLMKNIKMPIYTSGNQVKTAWDHYLQLRYTLSKVFHNLYYVLHRVRQLKLFIIESKDQHQHQHKDIDFCWNVGNHFRTRDYYDDEQYTDSQRDVWIKQQMIVWYLSRIKPEQGYKLNPQFDLTSTFIDEKEWKQYVNSNRTYKPKVTLFMFSPYRLQKRHSIDIVKKLEFYLNNPGRSDVIYEKVIFMKIGPLKYVPLKPFNDDFSSIMSRYKEKYKVSFEVFNWEPFMKNILKAKVTPIYRAITTRELPKHLRLAIQKEQEELKLQKQNKLLITDPIPSTLSRLKPMAIDNVIVQLYGWKPGQLVLAVSYITGLQQKVDHLLVVKSTYAEIMSSNIKMDEEEEEESTQESGETVVNPNPTS